MYVIDEGVSGYGELLIFWYFGYGIVIINVNDYIFVFVVVIRKIVVD